MTLLDLLSPTSRQWYRALFRPSPPRRDPGCPDLAAAIFRLKERLHDIAGDDWERSVVVAGRAVLAKGADSRRILFTWISVVESLVQTAEVEYAGRPGVDKKRLVKAIVRRLYRKGRLDLPLVPRWAEPLVVDGVVDVAIDFVVALNRANSGWRRDAVPRAGLASRLWWALRDRMARLKHLLGTVLRPLLRLVARLYELWTAVLYRLTPLPPGVEAALQEIDAAAMRRDFAALEDFVTALLAWLRDNRPRILAFLDLAAAAAREVEWFSTLDGPAKKVCARRMLLTVLADMGVETVTGLGAALLRVGIDHLVDAVVLLMNKRGMLKG